MHRSGESLLFAFIGPITNNQYERQAEVRCGLGTGQNNHESLGKNIFKYAIRIMQATVFFVRILHENSNFKGKKRNIDVFEA